VRTSSFKKEEPEVVSSPVCDSTSDDTSSLEEDTHSEHGNLSATLTPIGSVTQLLKLLKVSPGFYKLSEFDCRIGLNASQIHATYPCLLDQQNKIFYIFMGDIPIEKFSKSTLMNLANYAEKNGASSAIFVQNRNHL
jgi:hypothetical protein